MGCIGVENKTRIGISAIKVKARKRCEWTLARARKRRISCGLLKDTCGNKTQPIQAANRGNLFAAALPGLQMVSDSRSRRRVTRDVTQCRAVCQAIVCWCQLGVIRCVKQQPSGVNHGHAVCQAIALRCQLPTRNVSGNSSLVSNTDT